MPLVQIKIPNQLLIPFGGPKWSIERINLVGVSTTGTYIQSDTPLAHIDRSQQLGLRLRHFTDVLPGDWPDIFDATKASAFIQDHLRDKCELATDYERKFIDLYFEYLRERIAPPAYMRKSGKIEKSGGLHTTTTSGSLTPFFHCLRLICINPIHSTTTIRLPQTD
jgi:hypothetical protein